MRVKRYIAVVVALLLVLPALSGQDLVILHTNDVHSHIEPLKSGSNANLGGFQRRANYLQQTRESHRNVLLLDAGDFNQGTPYYTLFGGKMEVMLYNAMGYDAVALGNHEFDDGMESLANRLTKAEFTTLCSNYSFEGTPLEGMIEPYTIIEKGGYKIGIIGALLDLKGYVSKSAIEGLVYRNPIPIVNRIAKHLKKREQCDLIIVLSHMGYKGAGKSRPGDLEVAQYSKNVDMVIGGHTHTFLKEPTIVNNRNGLEVIVNQMGAHGIYVGRIDINF